MSHTIVLFTIYSFLGWSFESIMKTIRDKKTVNSGFLVGPFCPIYGFGALFVVYTIDFLDLSDSMIMQSMFFKILLTILITSLLEYLTGTMMEIVFGQKWWDYSREKYHIKGRVCLRFSIIWGVFGYSLITIIHPYFISQLSLMPARQLEAYGILMFFYFITDWLYTVRSLLSHESSESFIIRMKEAFPNLQVTHTKVKEYLKKIK